MGECCTPRSTDREINEYVAREFTIYVTYCYSLFVSHVVYASSYYLRVASVALDCGRLSWRRILARSPSYSYSCEIHDRLLRGRGTEKPLYISFTAVAGSGTSVPSAPRGPLAERFGRRCLVFRRTRGKVYAYVVVVVVSHADSAAESRGWIRARASPRFHGEATGLRARRPRRPSCPLAVNRAVGHSDSGSGARCSAMLRRWVVAVPRLALTDVRGLKYEKYKYESAWIYRSLTSTKKISRLTASACSE